MAGEPKGSPAIAIGLVAIHATNHDEGR